MKTRLAMVGVVLAGAGVASAGEVLYTLTASNANGTATFAITTDNVVIGDDGSVQWSLAGAQNLVDEQGNVIASVSNLGFGQSYDADGAEPRGGGPFFQTANLSLSFAVTAGALDTIFTLSSMQNLPSTFLVPQYEASASITVTDNDGVGGSASVTGNGDNGASLYNYGFNGTNFGGLLGGPLGTSTSETFDGGVPLTALGFPVNSFYANYSFVLTAGDSASGTSVLSLVDIVPAPSTLALVGVGGLVAARRRR